jgi:iron(III) transport system ATP-binding protein
MPGRGQARGSAEVALRPSAIVLAKARDPGAALDGKVVRSAYRGDCIEYVVGTDVGDLYVVDRLPRQRWNVGCAVSLRIEEDGVRLLQGEGDERTLSAGRQGP